LKVKIPRRWEESESGKRWAVIRAWLLSNGHREIYETASESSVLR
jgi:hypothetical protein